jgi:hypothetical protein
MLTLDRYLAFDAANVEAFLATLPAVSAIVQIEPRAELAGARPLLLRTADLRRRMRLLLGPREADAPAQRVHLADYAGGIRFRLTGSPLEQSLVHYHNARQLWPRDYRKRMRLRSPALIRFNQSSAYPRAYVTRRATAGGGMCFGPFASRRSAETFLESFLDLYRLRRCQIKILRDPSFPGCIYSEMKKCLAPCFAGCSDEDYAAEAERAASFLETQGESAVSAFEKAREEASAALEFERAAILHRDLDKAAAARRGIPEIAHTIRNLNAVILQRGAEGGSIAVFVARAGRLSDPFLVRFTELAGQPRSVEEILRAALDPVAGGGSDKIDTAPGAAQSAELEDHLALLARWFYARPRCGEIFFPEAGPRGWPYRRLLRACSRILHPEENDEKH